MTVLAPTLETASVHKLENGLTVAVERLPYLRSVSAGIWIRTGSANERDDENGLAHYLEHLFFKGTTNRTVHELMEAIEGRGGQLNAFTSREYTCLYVKMLDRHVHIGIEILADLVKNALFADWEKERNVILEEIASIEDTPDEYVHELLSEYHWPEHPLGRSIAGSQASVSALTRDHVVEFFTRWYKPENMVFSIAGNFDEEAVLAQLRREFETLAPAPVPDGPQAPRFQNGIRVVERDIAQAHLCLAFPAPPLTDDERYVCDVTSTILGGGSTSRLFESIREERGLAYAIYTFHSFHRPTGMLGIYAAVAPQNYREALELTCAELRRLVLETVSTEELEMNKEQIKGNMLMALESTFTRMSRMAKGLLHYGRIVPVEDILEKVDRVSAAQVRAFAERTFTAERTALVLLGPPNGALETGLPL